MIAWLIVDTNTKACKAFEIAFETERAAQMYVDAFGNDGWKVVPVSLRSEEDVSAIITTTR